MKHETAFFTLLLLLWAVLLTSGCVRLELTENADIAC